MGKIKAWYRSIPLWLAIFLFAATALIIASLVSNKVTNMANAASVQMQYKYFSMSILNNDEEDGENSVTYINTNGKDVQSLISPNNFTNDDLGRYNFYQIIIQYAPILIYSIFLILAALLLYITKLKKPLALLLNASAKIAKNEFDFSLDYSGHDEMAKLCGAFEKMRSSLDEYDLRMRQMIAERKQLNDAYTHDLRTPIAVLKGYTDTLSEYLPTEQLPKEKVIETVHTMSAHVERLRQFVDSMNTAQKLSDLPIQREAISTEDFIMGLRETTMYLCEKQNISCEIISDIEDDTLNIDPSAVTQVFENLLGNALRFAKARITVHLASGGKMFTVCIADDGRGFKEKELTTAAKPYYSVEQNEKTYHFGLGLYICHTLCEKHGGNLKLENAENGGAAVTAAFSL